MTVPDDYEFGTRGFDPGRWEGDDFTEPVGGPEEITMLGRLAWRVTLAPPPHKPEPMHMVIDQSTFLVLREGNDAFGTFHEWTELITDPEIDDALFTWTDTDRAAAGYEKRSG